MEEVRSEEAFGLGAELQMRPLRWPFGSVTTEWYLTIYIIADRMLCPQASMEQ